MCKEEHEDGGEFKEEIGWGSREAAFVFKYYVKKVIIKLNITKVVV